MLTSCSDVGPRTQARPSEGSGAEQKGALPAANAPGDSDDGALPVEPSPGGEAPLTPELPLNAAPPAQGSSSVTRFLSDACPRSEVTSGVAFPVHYAVDYVRVFEQR